MIIKNDYKVNYYDPAHAEDRAYIESWDTFQQLATTCNLHTESYLVCFIIEGLMRLGRDGDARALAIKALALTLPQHHADIHLALAQEFLERIARSSNNPENWRLKVALWIERERLYPTWP